jgi:hypothetical protein
MNIEPKALLERMKEYYDGFCFDGKTSVYNPFSTMQFLYQQEFKNYWFLSGTSSHLVKFLRDNRLTVEEFRGLSVDKDFAEDPGELDSTDPMGFLYQAGYLSLKSAGGTDGGFILDYPNREVHESMSRLLVRSFLGGEARRKRVSDDFQKALASGDVKAAVLELKTFLASVPYDDYFKAKTKSSNEKLSEIDYGEGLYRSCLHSLFLGVKLGTEPEVYGRPGRSGMDVQAEVHGSLGRADLVIKVDGRVWVLELKVYKYKGVGPSADAKAIEMAEVALAQILEKGYGERYKAAFYLGLSINTAKRALGAWSFQAGPLGKPETGLAKELLS